MDDKEVYDLVRDSVNILGEPANQTEVDEGTAFAPLAQRLPTEAAVILNIAVVRALTEAAPPQVVAPLMNAAGEYAEQFAAAYVRAETAQS